MVFTDVYQCLADHIHKVSGFLFVIHHYGQIPVHQREAGQGFKSQLFLFRPVKRFKIQFRHIYWLLDGEAAQHIRVELAHLPQFGVSAVDLGTAAGLIAGRASLSEGDLRYPELV